MTDLTESSAPTEAIADGASAPSDPIWTKRTAAAAAVLAALIVLVDVLFYPHDLGVNLAIYALALIAGTLALHPQRLTNGRTAVLAVLAMLAALPMAESQNILWAPFALGAAGLLALSASDNLPKFDDWFGAVTRFAVLAPARLVIDSFQLLIEAGQQKIGGKIVRIALVWVVPAVCAAIFLFLFVAANPVLEDWLHAIRLQVFFQLLDPDRVLIWGFFALISWPVLVPKLLHWVPLAEMQGPVRPKPESLIFGSAAIRNSLIVFNAMFAVQTLMDLAYLWGGVRLPDNLTYADYAHRGAYPLIVTAVLAGAFVLAAMRKDGPGRTSR
jgi:hypothetical protein